MDNQQVSIGADITSISRINRVLQNHPTKFRDFAFTPAEQRYCEARSSPAEHYAARWAIKEAYIKTVGKIGDNPDLTTIEIVPEPTPTLHLSGDGLALLHRAGHDNSVDREPNFSISMSHESSLDIALGIVIAYFPSTTGSPRQF